MESTYVMKLVGIVLLVVAFFTGLWAIWTGNNVLANHLADTALVCGLTGFVLLGIGAIFSSV